MTSCLIEGVQGRRARNPFVGDWASLENANYDTSQDERPSKENIGTLWLKKVLKGIGRVGNKHQLKNMISKSY